MKPIKLLSAIAFVSLLLTGCSDEPYVIDYGYLDSLTRGSTSSYYEFDSYSVYDKKNNSSKWKKIDLSDYVGGGGVPTPLKIFFLEGKLCLPLDLSSNTGMPHPISLPLEAYRRLTKFDSRYLITSPVSIKEGNKIILNGKDYEILSASKECIKLVYLSSYVKADGINGGTWKYIINFKRSEINPGELEKNLYYESKTDALLDIIRMLRARFGDWLDVNPYFIPQMELDYSIYDLKKIEENILAGNDDDFRGVYYSKKNNQPLM